MTTPDMVRVYVQQLCKEIGVAEETIYNKEKKAWYFTKGSVSIEVFMTSYETVRKTIRTFLRVFSPIHVLPKDVQRLLELYQCALEANTQYMGVKIATVIEKGFMYAVAERDIEGMDYVEFSTVINDLAVWADKLDDILKERFGTPRTAAN
jgi:hypothetical protein